MENLDKKIGNRTSEIAKTLIDAASIFKSVDRALKIYALFAASFTYLVYNHAKVRFDNDNLFADKVIKSEGKLSDDLKSQIKDIASTNLLYSLSNVTDLALLAYMAFRLNKLRKSTQSAKNKILGLSDLFPVKAINLEVPEGHQINLENKDYETLSAIALVTPITPSKNDIRKIIEGKGEDVEIQEIAPGVTATMISIPFLTICKFTELEKDGEKLLLISDHDKLLEMLTTVAPKVAELSQTLLDYTDRTKAGFASVKKLDLSVLAFASFGKRLYEALSESGASKVLIGDINEEMKVTKVTEAFDAKDFVKKFVSVKDALDSLAPLSQLSR